MNIAREGASLEEKSPSLALPAQEIYNGEILGGEAASLREAPRPRPPSRRTAGVWLGDFCIVEFRRSVGCEFPAGLVESTAARRPSRRGRAGVWGRTPPPAYGGHLLFRGGFAGNAAKGFLCGGSCPAARLAEDKLLCWGKPCHGGSEYLSPSAAADGLPPSSERGKGWRQCRQQVTVSCPLGATKGLSDRPLETFGPPAYKQYQDRMVGQGAAALSAAVPTTQPVGNAPAPFRRNHLCKSTPVKRQPLFGREREGGGFSAEKPLPARARTFPVQLLVERGSGGEALVLREAASPGEFHRLPLMLSHLEGLTFGVG